MQVSYMDTDVLIIGGGSAGSMAAIRLKELNRDQKVTIFEKANIKYSGSIPRGMDALNIVAVPGVNTAEDYVEAQNIACDGVLDEPPSFVMAQRSWDLMKELQSWGVYFPTDKNGNYEILKTTPKGRFTVTMREPNLKTILYERMKKLGVLVVNHTMALRLLVDNGRVAGAVGMNIRTGELIVCHAKAVILSAGGTARFGLPENGYLYGNYDCPANTGDAYVLAYRAGAELTGLEYTLRYYIVKDINCPLLYITMTRGARLLNAIGEDVGGDHPGIKNMFDEHFGRGLGYLRLRLSHLPHEKIEEVEDILFSTEKPVLQRYFEGKSVNFRSRDIELGPTDCYLCGGHGITGVSVNSGAAASVPGLYAAGDTANVHRGHLTGAFVFGQLAAESATEYIKSVDARQCDTAPYVQEIVDKCQALENNRGFVSIEEFEFKTRRAITDYVTPPKNEYKLTRAIEVMKEAQKNLRGHVRIRRVHDLWKAFEVENIIQCAILSATASLERKESRWGYWHYRADFPKTDPAYTKHIVVKRGTSDNDVTTRLREMDKSISGKGGNR